MILLRREADDPNLTGVVQYQHDRELGGLNFRFRVVRAWEWPVEEVLAGGLGTLPLAPLSAEVTEANLPAVIRRMEGRLREAAPADAAKLWTVTFVLLGLRFPRPLALQLLQGVHAMKESVTYQAIVEEGEIKRAKKVLLRLGNDRFGPADPTTQAAIESMEDADHLEELAVRVSKVNSWQELLAPR